MVKNYKKIFISIIVIVVLVLFFLMLSLFTDFKAWHGTSSADIGMISVLNQLGLFIFIIFGILSLLKYIFPELIIRYVINGIGDITYIMIFRATLTLIMPLIIFKVRFFWFIWQYSAISFIYLFGVTTICIEIFKLRK